MSLWRSLRTMRTRGRRMAGSGTRSEMGGMVEAQILRGEGPVTKMRSLQEMTMMSGSRETRTEPGGDLTSRLQGMHFRGEAQSLPRGVQEVNRQQAPAMGGGQEIRAGDVSGHRRTDRGREVSLWETGT